LVIDDPWALVQRFFPVDPGSAGHRYYDEYSARGAHPNRVVDEDITVINARMTGRSSHSDWAHLIARRDLKELAAIDTSWDLFLTPDKVWRRDQVGDKLIALFTTVIGPGIGIARATKVLHIKRPRLIPVCDSYVLGLMGILGGGPTAAVALMEHLRAIRGELRPTLVDYQGRLRELGLDRTLVRIADGLIWGTVAWERKH
jgi:hypothetical protein